MKEKQKKERMMEENKNIGEELAEETVADCAEQTADTETADKCEATEEMAGCTAETDEKLSRADKKKLKKAEERVSELEAELTKSAGELAAANDKYMRLYAEYDNFRKRSQKEKEGTYADAYSDALTQILPILDNLERAAQFGAEDAESQVAKGLELTLKSFSETLAKMGVAEIPALGEKFDPNVHNAVMHIDDDTFGENEVVEVLMKGYIKGDKVIRYSMVKVAN